MAKRDPMHPRIIIERLRGAAVMAVLILVLLFVLLPMIWMILTAFKVRGTAFRMEFIPKVNVTTPLPADAPFRVPVVKPGEKWLHVELERPNAQEITVILQGEDGTITSSDMRLTIANIWAADIGPMEGEEVHYKFKIDGDAEITDPQIESQRDGYSVVELNESMTTPYNPRFLLVQDDAMRATIRTAEGQQLRLAGEAQRTLLVLKEESPGYYIGSAPTESADLHVRLVRRIPFAEAAAKLYTTSNFATILNNPAFQFKRYFLNSLIVATGAALLTVLICTMAGYAFAQKEFHYRDQLFAFLLTSMLVPGMIYMVPQFSITLKLGWLNSFQGMIVPHLANVFGLFLLRQYIAQIPSDLFRAAEIDGANDIQVFGRIVMPVCTPIMVTLFLLVFVGQWSNFLWQLIVNTGDPATMTLPVGLQQFKGQNAVEWELIMAGACFSILPIAVLFLSLQKYFLSGLTAGAVKE